MRILAKWVVTLIILLLLLITVTLALLQSRFATPIINRLAIYSPYPIQFQQVSYSLKQPWHMTFIGPSWSGSEQPRPIAQRVELWWSANLTHPRQFDSVLVAGIHYREPSQFTLPAFAAKRLALTDVSLLTPNFVMKNGKIELNNWHSSAQYPWWQSFQGEFIVSADRIDYHHQELNQLLINGRHSTTDKWLFDGLSFTWQHAQVSGQAIYHPQEKRLTLAQFTVQGLQLQQDSVLHSLNDTLKPYINTLDIERFDLLESSVELKQLTANGVNLSLENITWPKDLWQQQGQISLSANNIQWQHITFDNPLLDMQLQPNQLIISGLSSQLLSGYINLNGTITPTTLSLKKVIINGIKWILPNGWLTQFQQFNLPWQQIEIQHLDTSNLLLTSTDPDWLIQMAGLDITGDKLTWHHKDFWQLWQGELAVSSSFSSINQIILNDPIMEMSSDQGNWQLKRVVLPFKDGLLRATGKIELSQSGRPWQLSINGDSVPTRLLHAWLKLPLPITGVMDNQIQLHGLSSDKAALDYSLSGHIYTQWRDNQFIASAQQYFQDWQQAQWQPKAMAKITKDTKPHVIDIAPLQLQLNRGIASVSPWHWQNPSLSGTLTGQWDFTQRETDLQLNLIQDCQQLNRYWRQDKSQVTTASSCTGSNK